MTTVASGQFATLVAQVREGSQDAAREMVERYGPHILRVVRRTLCQEIRNKFDSQDFVQAVWASVFAHREQLMEIETPEQLAALLSAMARNKTVDEMRRRLATQKYDVRRECSMDDSTVVINETLASHDPTPSQVAVAREQWNQMLAGQPSQFRDVVQMRVSGETHAAIAEKLGISQKTVQRILNRMSQERERP